MPPGQVGCAPGSVQSPLAGTRYDLQNAEKSPSWGEKLASCSPELSFSAGTLQCSPQGEGLGCTPPGDGSRLWVPCRSRGAVLEQAVQQGVEKDVEGQSSRCVEDTGGPSTLAFTLYPTGFVVDNKGTTFSYLLERRRFGREWARSRVHSWAR